MWDLFFSVLVPWAHFRKTQGFYVAKEKGKRRRRRRRRRRRKKERMKERRKKEVLRDV
jgi:hypothetical protein